MKLYRTKKAEEGILRTYDRLVSAWGIPVTETDVETRYGKTHILAAGGETAEPLILLHGVGDDSALMWVCNAKALSEHFRIFAVDTIGGPGKSRPDSRYDKNFVDELWLDDVLDALRLEKASFVGVSHGGYMVQLYTLNRPERVKKAVAISSAVPAEQKSGSPMKAMLQIFLPEALFPTEKNVQKLLRKLSGQNVRAFLDNDAIMAHYRWLLKGFHNAAMAYHKVRSFTEAEIDGIRDRILYLAGDRDPFQKRGGKEALQSNGMQTVFYQSAGHGLNHELAEEINRKLIEYLGPRVNP